MPVERPPWLDCHACQLHFHRNRDPLMAACATVGIEHGVDRHSVLRSWLDGYHADGHVEPEVEAELIDEPTAAEKARLLREARHAAILNGVEPPTSWEEIDGG